MAPPSGLVGWWSGEGTADDALGVSNGALQGATAFTAGKVGQAFLFDGTNSFVQIPDSAQLSPDVGAAGEMTIEAWVLIPRLPQFDDATGLPYRAIAAKGSSGQWEYALEITTNAEPFFRVWQLNGATYAIATGNALTLNQWHHLAGTVRKGQFVRLYVDGQLASEVTSFSGDTGDGSSPLFIGKRGDGQFFDGTVDELSIYARALSDAEIQAIYNAGASGKCSTITGASVPYFTDFENGIGPEWSEPSLNKDETAGFTRFNGRFGNNYQMLTVTNLVPGQSYTLGFDFYAIDSWDGGQDAFNVTVNGLQLFHEIFSNFNAEPPSHSQSFRPPDEGRANFGFAPDYVDAIYRNLEVDFTASNAVATIIFNGQNLEAIDNESWGVDNVSLRLTSDLADTFIRTTTLPPNNSTNDDAIESFSFSASRPLLSSTTTNTANYSLREAGVNGILGDRDDVIFSLTPSLPGAGGRSVVLAPANVPLQPGHYRFQTTIGLEDENSNSIPAFTRDFTIANPPLGKIESTSDDTLANATPLPVTESPAASGFFTAFAIGTFSSSSDVDYWSFNAEAGDVLTVRLESESQGNNAQIYLQNASGQNVANYGAGSSSVVGFQNFVISNPGTYYLRVFTSNYRSRYWIRFDQSRGPQMESENNDSQSKADLLNLAFGPGISQARIVGSLPSADSAGDYFRLGTLNTGNSISISSLFPDGSALDADNVSFSIQAEGNPAPLASNTGADLNFTVVSNSVYYIHVETGNRDLRAQYLLNVTVSDGVPPEITETSLPAEGSSTSSIVDQFTLDFSEDILASSASNSANYELRGSGADGNFGTSDDTFYQVIVSAAGYTNGLEASYVIPDGPLQVGDYRLTVTGLADRADNVMAAPFVRNFSVENLPGFILESRNDGIGGRGTLLGTINGTNGDGTFAQISSTGGLSNPHDIAAGKFNGDTNLDLVVANWNGGNVSVLTNDGTGAFSI
ncbi:MAG TPA: LamG-like jellyroll fold domain-containing protein, partial [Verrucomicrobiae bacterium]|nr:LamG-like jellyroll fold domain-containing protein [Verrucomicrobiae bacterium]